MAELSGKTILVGVTGGIAAYKIPNLVSILVQKGADVHVLLTENAKNIIPPVPFEALTGNRCLTSPFERSDPPVIHHIALAKKADLMFIAPASADVIGKCANGIADDMLTSTILACKCPIYFAPAMNDRMYTNSIVQENMAKLVRHGWHQINPATGHLACGGEGLGKMPNPDQLYLYIERELAREKDMAGVKLLVTAGATQEAIDPVRYITNHSSGKMGYAIAKEAMLRGAEVTLVSGVSALTPPVFVETVTAVSAEDMYREVTSRAPAQDIIIKAAAVADYTPICTADEKIKKSDGDLSIPLKRTKDILGFLGEHKAPEQVLCGFSMETEHMLENSRKKLTKKNADLIAANNVKVQGAGFQGDTNVLTLITAEDETELPLMSKQEAAGKLLDRLMEIRRKKKNG
ncbi:MAG: bifunctional phosphopantothenoylcysteine decarboxylase/phosphopantothenate--cysteine ligase CoaBC [Candidatus Faecivivens sp.]|nr:bifunctional phosphopantothenoylcysteine decarboxylase/phosphopantothenate--cysteine ligase CoaBC [Oscillospiraceae bacterium]MDY2712775.1 bifunctional phosphopantothenoylcysteine decarboxylase/phosphopantothenate--cysteine ligase CoaBC [Candidatus Faecivivens sp.]